MYKVILGKATGRVKALGSAEGRHHNASPSPGMEQWNGYPTFCRKSFIGKGWQLIISLQTYVSWSIHLCAGAAVFWMQTCVFWNLLHVGAFG
jgi:hypothetical protein